MPPIFYGAIGLLFGSFANVYFHRLPQGISLWFPRSFCPACRRPIPWFDNVPLISFLALRGRCRSCCARIAWRYPAVEALCGLLFYAVAARWENGPAMDLGAFLVFYYLLFLAGGIDLATFFRLQRQYGIIPDFLVAVLFLAGASYAPFNPYFEGRLLSAVGGVLITAAALTALRAAAGVILKREALGIGDIKLLSAIAAWSGWKGALLALIAGSALGSLVSLGLILGGKMERKSALPFAPFLAAGALAFLALP